MPSNSIRFNVILDTARRSRLSELSMTLGISMGAVVRQLIDNAYTMKCLNTPTCADGHQCFVPQMHQTPTTPSPQPKEQ